jgi:hypothetical protein
MLLVPKQLLRAGMTGAVPYYGGRFSPAQAYAASHPTTPPPSYSHLTTAGGSFARQPVPSRGTDSAATTQPDAELSLQHLLAAGVITQAEFQELRARVIT